MLCTYIYVPLILLDSSKCFQHSIAFFFFLVNLCYIGAGRRGTGDWCFEDGFITFRDLAHLYLQLLRGHVLSIVTDCSHSGSWVRECMTFLDEQGVQPCGHSARDKEILIKVFASCLSHQVPRQLAFSVHACTNDKSTGKLMFCIQCCPHSDAKVADDQYTIGMDFTAIVCGHYLAEDCLCLPQANWQTWIERHMITTFTGNKDNTWYVTLPVKDETIIVACLEKMQSGKTVNLSEFGEVLKFGKGEKVPEEILESVLAKYSLYGKENPTG